LEGEVRNWVKEGRKFGDCVVWTGIGLWVRKKMAPNYLGLRKREQVDSFLRELDWERVKTNKESHF